MKKVYISGPMTGIENFNIKAFQLAEAKFTIAGYEVYNPIVNAHLFKDIESEDKKYSMVMRKDLIDLLYCDCIAMLKGWEQSNGAKVELLVAQTCGLEVLCAETMQPLNAKVDYYFTYGGK